MGSSAWSDASYKSRASLRAATNAPVFAYTSAIDSGAVAPGVHASLDPKRVAGKTSALAGQNVRECLDSEAHPLSNAVAIGLDVTGSMRQVPVIIQKKLVELMGLLLRKSYLSDPAILISAIGDAYSDQVPFQLGQFESGIEIENDLTNLYLEGNGGGQYSESYDLFLYFLARKTSLDCLTKRGKKGYAIIVGDEKGYKHVSRKQVKDIFGDDLQADIPFDEILAEAQAKFDIYFIMPNLTSYYSRPDVGTADYWQSKIGQNFIRLDDPNGISELIATIIGVAEGVAGDDVTEDLTSVGTDLATANSVNSAITKLKRGTNEMTPLSGTSLTTF